MLGTPQSRAQQLQGEVDSWSKLRQEGATCPPLAFTQVPCLPNLSMGDLVEASRSFKKGTCALG